MTADEFLDSEQDLIPVRQMSYGPIQGEYHHAANFGPNGQPLSVSDVAASPNLAEQGIDQGDLIMADDGTLHQVNDASYFTPNRPTQNTIEFRDRPDTGHGFIQKVNSIDDFLGGKPSKAAAGTAEPTIAPANLPREEQGLVNVLERHRVEAAQEGIYPKALPVTEADKQAEQEQPDTSKYFSNEGLNDMWTGLFGTPDKPSVIQRAIEGKSPVSAIEQGVLRSLNLPTKPTIADLAAIPGQYVKATAEPFEQATYAATGPEAFEKPLVSKESIASAFAPGPSPLAQFIGGKAPDVEAKIRDSVSGILSKFTSPQSLSQLVSFVTPGTVGAWVADTAVNAPTRLKDIKETADKTGWDSQETINKIGEEIAQDAMALHLGVRAGKGAVDRFLGAPEVEAITQPVKFGTPEGLAYLKEQRGLQEYAGTPGAEAPGWAGLKSQARTDFPEAAKAFYGQPDELSRPIAESPEAAAPGEIAPRQQELDLGQAPGVGVPPPEGTVEEGGQLNFGFTRSEPFVSRIANQFVDDRVASGEIGEIVPGQGYSTRELVARGLSMPPERVAQAASNVVQAGSTAIDDAAAIRAEESRLSQRSQQLARIAQDNPGDIEAQKAANDAFADLTDYHNGPVAQVKQNFHGIGVSLQGEVPVDLSTFNGLREAWLRDTGKAPPDRMNGEFRSTARSLSKAIDQENDVSQRLGEEIDRQSTRRQLPNPEDVRDGIMERMGIGPCRI